MSNKRSSILPDSKQGDNIFDKYFTFIDKQKISAIDDLSLSGLEHSVTIIERNLIDLSQNNKASSELIEELNDGMQSILDEWFLPLTMFSSNELFVTSLAYNLFGLSLLANETNWTDRDSLRVLLSFFAPSKDYVNLFKPTMILRPNRHDDSSHFDISEKAAIIHANNLIIDPKNFSVPSRLAKDFFELNEHLNFKLHHRRDAELFGISTLDLSEDSVEQLRSKTRAVNLWETINNYQLSLYDNAQSEWSIKIQTDEDHPEASDFFEMLHHFSLALKLVDEQIEVKLEDWGNGSKWALLKVTIKSFFSREDVKSILEKAFNSADAQLVRKPIAEADKVEAEAERIQKETANLKTREQAFESEELDLQLKRINVVKGALEAEDQMLNNRLKAIQVVNQLSDLVKNGLVKNDGALSIEINGLLAYQSGELIQTKMDEIANRESIQPKLSTPDASSTEHSI